MLAKSKAISFLQTVVALLLIFGCLYASQWQFNRGTAAMANNSIIKTNLDLGTLNVSNFENLDPVKNQWRVLKISGKFSPDRQELVRNRYYEGKFGFEVLTLFTSDTGENFWVDRGWVAAGPNATTPPIVSKPTAKKIEITARIRSENLSRQLQGSFFVTKASSEKPADMTEIQGVTAQPYYLDLIDSTDSSTKPLTEIELPELSNGPHFAYAIQWLAFAVLALVGRILLFRETKRLALVQVEI